MLDYTAWDAHPYLRSPSRSLLSESIRREITELNRQFFAVLSGDDAGMLPLPWRELDSTVLNAPTLIDLLAPCPFTLFALQLDAPPSVGPVDPATHQATANGQPLRPTSHDALAQSALTLAWRLAESSPLSLRLALGLSAAAELALNEIRVTSLPVLARKPGLVRTRWIAHDGFWAALLRAARRRDAGLLARVHCLGITLLVADLGAESRTHEPGANVVRCQR